MKQKNHLEEYFRDRRNGVNTVDLGVDLACYGDGEMNLAAKGEPCC